MKIPPKKLGCLLSCSIILKRGKHASLFVESLSDEGKKCFIILKPDVNNCEYFWWVSTKESEGYPIFDHVPRFTSQFLAWNQTKKYTSPWVVVVVVAAATAVAVVMEQHALKM
jgi:hypothetical protein